LLSDAASSTVLEKPGNVDEYIEAFAGDCRLRGMTPYSVHSYMSALRSLRNHLDSKGIHDIAKVDKEAIRDYIRVLREERKLSMSTIENHLSSISGFFDYLVYEEIVEANLALLVRKRYLRRYKSDGPGDAHSRKLITTEQLKKLVESALVPRDKAVILLLAKTGVRRGELVTIDLNDADPVQGKITLKPKAKRSNRVVFLDEECGRVLQDWLSVRSRYATKDSTALFVTSGGGRLDKNGVYNIVTGHAKLIGLHNPDSDRLEDHFTPHCLRHWFTTHLRRNGMPREMVQELRGDVRWEAIDIYHHIDEEELRRAYLAAIPRLGIE